MYYIKIYRLLSFVFNVLFNILRNVIYFFVYCIVLNILRNFVTSLPLNVKFYEYNILVKEEYEAKTSILLTLRSYNSLYVFRRITNSILNLTLRRPNQEKEKMTRKIRIKKPDTSHKSLVTQVSHKTVEWETTWDWDSVIRNISNYSYNPPTSYTTTFRLRFFRVQSSLSDRHTFSTYDDTGASVVFVPLYLLS